MAWIRIVCLWWICGTVAHAQGIVGKVTDAENKPLPDASVLLKDTKYTTKTDAQGKYTLQNIPQGTYTLIAFLVGKATEERVISLQTNTLEIDFTLSNISNTLEAVSLEAQNEQASRHLRSVENFGIYEGKKTEVITIKELTANLSTNNPRQIYSKITGLNIWESDGVGLQLGIGGRGLSPNRTANFNVRQNGYDISADALGYPESYYTPPVEALERIEIVRGAASLQYGTQFGGMLNFRFKRGAENKKIEFTTRQSVGSWGYFGTFNSVGGTVGKVQYYAYYQYKTGNGYRPNSGFDYHSLFASVQYKPNERLKLAFDLAKMNYLAQQAGGLTDKQFKDNPLQSFRERNWFKVDWLLPAMELTYQIKDNIKINSRTFGLWAGRKSLGNLENINLWDEGKNRTLIAGEFHNIGNETRYLQNYEIKGKPMAFLGGFRVYRGTTTARQGDADNGKGATFSFLNPERLENSDYTFPNENYALFAENIFNITDKFSLTPGVRFENIRTFSEGYYREFARDGAGNLLHDSLINETLQRKRSFMFFGLGLSYKMKDWAEFYANISQNYRAINFTDLRIVNPNFEVDPNIQDEKGYTFDVGVRGEWKNKLRYEVTAFYLAYQGRIGQILRENKPPLYKDYRYRTNIGNSRNVGVEFFGEWKIDLPKHHFSAFVNCAVVDARYTRSENTAIAGKKVEMVPPVMLRLGITHKYKNLATTLQWAYTGKHFSDATNAKLTANAIEGIIPAYQVADFSVRYSWRWLTFEGSINNVFNSSYFTRRAEAYPGPGIIPADGRGFYATMQARF